MKLAFLLALSSTFVAAVAQPVDQDKADVTELSIFQEAIIEHCTLKDDVFSLFTEENGNRFIVMGTFSITERAHHEDGENMHKSDAK